MSDTLKLRRNLPLTPRQREVIEFIAKYTDEHGYSPSFVEIGIALGGINKATVHEHIDILTDKGLITRSRAGRSTRLSPSCFDAGHEMVGAGIPACAQCLTCETFVYPPALEVSMWTRKRDEVGEFFERTITTKCPACDTLSEHKQVRRIGSI